MKGIVFTEFLDFAEARLGMAMVDRVIAAAHLPSGGAYTAVGTYPPGELFALVGGLAQSTGVPVATLVREFGEHLFARFVAMFPRFFIGIDSAFSFLERVDGVIHQEVRKLYPDAELPRFETTRTDDGRMRLVYRSERPLADLAEGLIRGCGRHFGSALSITRHELPADDGSAVCFDLACPTPTPQTTR